MNFKKLRDKAVEKATGLAANEKLDGIRNTAAKMKESEQLNKIWDKAVEQATEPKTKKQLAANAAISLGIGIVTGGAALPVIAMAATEMVVTKKWTESDKAKQIAANHKNKVAERKNGPKPE